MNKKIITLNLIFILICFCSISFAAKWDKTDKALFGAFTTTMIIDCLQTNYAFTHKDFSERNSIIREGVHSIGREFIPIYFGVCTIGSWYILNKFSSRNKKFILIGLTLFNISTISHNKNEGAKLNFKF